MNNHELWYDGQIALGRWNEALPIGNGRLGAMIFGRVDSTRIQVNEDSVWYGGYQDRNNKEALSYLPEIRKMLLDHRIKEAERLMTYAFSGTPQSEKPYQPLGDVDLRFSHPSGKVCHYRRSLSLEEAIARIAYQIGDIHYEREIFASHPDEVMVARIRADKEKQITFSVLLRRGRFYEYVKQVDEQTIVMGGTLGPDGEEFAMMLRMEAKGGTTKWIGEHMIVEEADEVVLYIAGGTTFRYANLEEMLLRQIEDACSESYEKLKERHIRDYQSLYHRVQLDLSSDCDSTKDCETTARRLERVADDDYMDPGMYELYFNYGRYLMISCSRPGTLPANLQGIWNESFTPPWDSKYTININTEMNYWPAEVCNLSECHLPLFDLLKKMLPNGQKTAQKMYGCRGFVAHHNTDIHGDTAPQDVYVPATYWVMGAAWLSTHIWTHYVYSRDKEFLKEYYPIMKEASLFFLDFLIEDNGYLKTCPSVSPENTFIMEDGAMGSNTTGVTMDNQILRDLFAQTLKAAYFLEEKEDEILSGIREAQERLIPTQIGKHGQIMEWEKDYEEWEPGHRHISHLYGLYPSHQISMDGTPELAKAAKVTLERRLASGGGHTGWSRAWIINHYARLWDGEKAFENLRQLLIQSTLPNLFDNHPPFQIDGNFGATAAIAEMLMQSNEHRIVLLPALPEAWPSGSVRGLCVYGGAEIDITWEQHELKDFTIRANHDIHTAVIYHNQTWDISLAAGEVFHY
ncbi:MAG: glycosyl hydrolase family 95 catalytic domain-containing protein [Lachnospiraceae bacterium]